MIPLNEVPQEVFDEIKSNYPSLDLSVYLNTEVKENWRTMKLSFQEKISDAPVTVDMIDPLTYELKKVTGIPHRTFIVRGIFNGDNATVFQIADAGIILRK